MWGVIGEGCRKDECQILSVVTDGLLKIVSSFTRHSTCHVVTNCQNHSHKFAQLIFNYWGGYEQIFFTKDQIVILRKYAHSIDWLPFFHTEVLQIGLLILCVCVINELSSEEEKANL